MDRSVITVVGRDNVGIIATICTALAQHKVNILEISQTIMSDIFNMMMIVDTSACDVSHDDLNQNLQQIAGSLGIHLLCQKEEIFDKMHRI